MMGVAIIALAALTIVQPVSAWGTGEWIDARATFYGRDAWPLHIGSCGFGFVCPTSWSGELKHGYDLVALSDQNPLFTGQQGSSCGQCLEVKCRAATIKDGFGDSFDRTQQCLNDLSVKVKVADTCQCEYAANAQSNKRWCCGDYPHLDMSQWALEKIAQDPDKWGVFGISYRTIDCKAAIADEAPNPSSIPADPHTGQRKSGEPCAGGGGEGSSNSAGSSSGGSVSTESSSKTRAVAAPEPTPSPTPDPTSAPKPKPAPRPDPTPAPTPNPTPRRTPSPTPEPTPEPTPNPTPESTAASAQRQASSRRSGTPRPTAQPTAQPTPKPSAEPSTPKPSPKPSAQPLPKPSAQPSPKPSARPSPKPSAAAAQRQQRSAAKPSPKPSRSAAKPSPQPSPKSSAKPSPKPSRQTVSVNTQSASRKRAADSGSGGSSSGGGSSGTGSSGSSGSDRIPVSQVPKVTCSERKHSPKFYVRQQVYIDGRRTSPNPPGYYPRIFAYFEQFDDNMMPLEQLDSIKPLDGRTPGVPLDCNELPDDPEPQRKKGSKEWTHSPKYWTRRDIYMQARDTAPNPRGYYSRIVQYFAQFGPNMKPLDDSKPVEPLVR